MTTWGGPRGSASYRKVTAWLLGGGLWGLCLAAQGQGSHSGRWEASRPGRAGLAPTTVRVAVPALSPNPIPASRPASWGASLEFLSPPTHFLPGKQASQGPPLPAEEVRDPAVGFGQITGWGRCNLQGACVFPRCWKFPQGRACSPVRLSVCLPSLGAGGQ